MKKIFFLIILFFSSYNVFTCCHGLYSLIKLDKQKDILVYSKFAYTYGTEKSWMDCGAEEVVSDYESGYRFINFKDYETFYQAYDEHDDILGTIIEKKTGREKLNIKIEFGDGLSLNSSELSKSDFSIFNIPDIVYQDIQYINGTITGTEGLSYEKPMLETACEQLIKSVNDFEEIACKIYQETYQAQWAEKAHKLFHYVFLSFGCLIVWWISNSYWFNYIIIRKKK